MILSGSTIRSVDHARKMTTHLFKGENEIVSVQQTLDGQHNQNSFAQSMIAMQLYTLQTKGNTGLFHVAIAPREDEQLTSEQYDRAIAIIEERMKLSGQERIRIDHIKGGRAHAHVLWSTVDQEQGKLIQLNYYKRNLQTCADKMVQEFELEEVNRLPDGQTIEVTNADRMRDERSKGEGREVKPSQERKKEIAALWEQTETGADFLNALQSAGYEVGINETYGEKSGRKRSRFVLLDEHGTEYNLSRELPRLVKTKAIRERFAGYELPTMEVVRQQWQERQHYDREQATITRTNEELIAADKAAQKTILEESEAHRKEILAKQAALVRQQKAQAWKKAQAQKAAIVAKLKKEQETLPQQQAQVQNDTRDALIAFNKRASIEHGRQLKNLRAHYNLDDTQTNEHIEAYQNSLAKKFSEQKQQVLEKWEAEEKALANKAAETKKKLEAHTRRITDVVNEKVQNRGIDEKNKNKIEQGQDVEPSSVSNDNDKPVSSVVDLEQAKRGKADKEKTKLSAKEAFKARERRLRQQEQAKRQQDLDRGLDFGYD